MITSFKSRLGKLRKATFVFGPASEKEKLEALALISKTKWKTASELNEYHDLLLFLAAHPESPRIEKSVHSDLKRILKFFQVKKNANRPEYQDSGFPCTRMNTRFSHDLLRWMKENGECEIQADEFDAEGVSLNDLLKLTLPSVEREETTADLDNAGLLDALGIPEKNIFPFLLDEFSKIDELPLIKDHLWDSMKLWLNIRFLKPGFSRTFNRISIGEIFYQQELMKRFDHQELMARALPQPEQLNPAVRKSIAGVIKKSLILTMRETDPSTYMDENSMRIYSLERGVCIAIYGMVGIRQLPLQSYIGYTLFKNGYPAAYGGSWIFGEHARFGLNIFEAFRGGESGFAMCQLLRVYRQVFQVRSFEVEAFQFGKDNPDGIKSGAFWFYYRYGFRLIDKKLQSIAEKEAEKIRSKPGYRSAESTLIRFTESNIRLDLGKSRHPNLEETGKKISSMIRKEFKGNRLKAERQCREEFLNLTGGMQTDNAAEAGALSELSFLRKALKIGDAKQLELMKSMIRTKPQNPYVYNELLIRLFSGESAEQ